MVKEWSEAEVIVEVQDNLNTHNASSFYENLPAPQARELTTRFEFHFTPKKASWLNMAEMELSALSRQCFKGRRIPEIETLIRFQLENYAMAASQAVTRYSNEVIELIAFSEKV